MSANPGHASTSTSSIPKSALSVIQNSVPLLAAIIVLVAFGYVLKAMLSRADTEVTPEIWARYTYLFSSLEALAYAAAGFLFGREVNRQRAENAEANAEKSQEIAFQAQGSAAVSEANGQALAESVRALDDAVRRPEIGGGGAESVPADPQMSAAVLRTMADRMFPNRRPS